MDVYAAGASGDQAPVAYPAATDLLRLPAAARPLARALYKLPADEATGWEINATRACVVAQTGFPGWNFFDGEHSGVPSSVPGALPWPSGSPPSLARTINLHT